MAGVAAEVGFFTEKAAFHAHLSGLLGSDDDGGDVLVVRMCEIVDKYQEQPHLLDPHLEPIIAPIMQSVRARLRAWRGVRNTSAAFGGQVYTDRQLHRMLQVVYHICKTRGYKQIIKFFPHEVSDLEPAVAALLCQDTSDHGSWETRYVLLLWLSILVLIPFDLSTVDSSLGAGGGRNGGPASGGGGLLIDAITGACTSFLADPGAVRDAAAVCLSRLLTRPDMDTARLKAFMTWSTVQLAACIDTAPPAAGAELADAAGEGEVEAAGEGVGLAASGITVASRAFLATGLLQALVECAKHGHRSTLAGVLSDVFSRVSAILGGSVGVTQSGGGRAGGRISPLLRKLTIKLAARTGLTYLPPRIVAWRYSRGSRSLLDNLSTAGVAAASVAKAAQAAAAAAPRVESSGSAGLLQSGNDGLREDGGEGDGPGEGGVEVPAEMEGIIDLLLQGLRDTDTVVRWSAAKGTGRLTGRLPLEYADDVVGAVLELLVPRESDAAWHGGCLALAELARRGLLLPARLAEVVPLVLSALAYDVRRGSHSVGAHVRDAACYVCWAFARAYAPGVMRPYVLPLARGMLVTALFDREVNCRRAASAAFQENVGRQGHENFPSGIAILTAADYYSLGVRANAYLGVAPVVARFPAYCSALQQHVLSVKMRHWDKDVRMLAARAAAALAEQDPAWAIETALPTLLPLAVSPDVFTRHGAIGGIAELVLALARAVVPLPTTLQDDVRNVVVVAEKARAYMGRGGEMVRVAMCRLIEAQALAGHALSRKAALRLLQTVDECLKHPNDSTQACAVAALRALSHAALAEPDAATLDRLPRGYAAKLADENPAVRRGACLALGALPRSLLAAPGVADTVLAALMRATQPEKQAYKRDAETRRNAAIGLGEMVATLGFGAGRTLTIATGQVVEVEGGGGGLSAAQLSSVWECLTVTTRDYSVDNRGDVGSWVRKAALESMERVLTALQAARAVSVAVEGALAGLAGSEAARAAALATLLPLASVDAISAVGAPLTGLEAAQCASGYGNISGYAAGARILTAEAAVSGSAAVRAALALPPQPGTTTSGLRVGDAVTGGGKEGILAGVVVAGEVCAVWTAGGVVAGVRAGMLSLCTRPLDGALIAGFAASLTTLRLPCAPAALGDDFFSPSQTQLTVGTFLRQSVEKLDLLRAVAADALCRLLHLPPSVPALLGLSHRPALEAAFPPPAAARVGGEGEADAEGVDEEGRVADAAAPASAPPSASADVQWSIPHQCFPRLTPLLSCPPYVPYLVEGLVTAVGGLSESVVRHSGAALSAWAGEAKRQGDTASLAAVAQALLTLLQPRPRLAWEVANEEAAAAEAGAGGAGAQQGYDPSLARWFKDILGGDAPGTKRRADGAPATDISATHKLDARVVVPSLRTIDLLLSSSLLSGLHPPGSNWGVAAAALVRRRVLASREDVPRVLAAASVLLGLLTFPPPVLPSALLSLLDLLGHPFPRVRKAVAELMYVRLMVLGEGGLGVGEGGLDAALSQLSETGWDGEVGEALPARDALYPLFGLAPPERRMGTSDADRALAAGGGASGAGAGGEGETDFSSYGALAREAGY